VAGTLRDYRARHSIKKNSGRRVASYAISADIQSDLAWLGSSQTCFRYQAERNSENEAIADWLMHLANNQRNWGIGHASYLAASRWFRNCPLPHSLCFCCAVRMWLAPARNPVASIFFLEFDSTRFDQAALPC